MTPMTIIDEILFALANDPIITDKDAFHKLKNTVFSKYRVSVGPSHIALIERYNELVEKNEIPDDSRQRERLTRADRSDTHSAGICLRSKRQRGLSRPVGRFERTTRQKEYGEEALPGRRHASRRRRP